MNNIVVSNQINNKTSKLFEKFPFKIGPAQIKNFSDRELYDYCRFAGINARIWTRRFIAAIPEVARRHLYLKYKFRSIHEFASKIGGLSHKTVNETLRINEKFKDFPKMKELIGEVGISKLKVVACIVTSHSEQFWAAKVVDMSRPALEVLVRGVKNYQEMQIIRENPLNVGQKVEESEILSSHNQENKPSLCPKSPWEPGISGKVENRITEKGKQDGMAIFRKAQTNEQTGMFEKEFRDAGIVNGIDEDAFKLKNKKAFVIHIDDDTEFRLRKFKLNLEKEKKQVLDWNKTIKELVKRVEK
ncbi:hypothetical protein JW911_01090 [Candidatus Peregrinibacteria bacterium]|nr:hypothetical protein [Candidatus Peregrinibacteria bacterium]